MSGALASQASVLAGSTGFAPTALATRDVPSPASRDVPSRRWRVAASLAAPTRASSLISQ